MSFGARGLGGLFFLATAGLLLALKLFSSAYLGYSATFGDSATAIVVSTVSKSAPRGGSSRRPLARFIDENGREHSVEGFLGLTRRGSSRPNVTHAIGERVLVVYPEGQPQEAMMADAKSIFWRVFIILFLTPFVVAGAWLIRSDQRRQREDGWTMRRF
jgi:hypothetical protein